MVDRNLVEYALSRFDWAGTECVVWFSTVGCMLSRETQRRKALSLKTKALVEHDRILNGR